MTLREISYSILEIVRNANIVDDERIDIRLLDLFINKKRAEIIARNNKEFAGNELLKQTMILNMAIDGSTTANPILKSTRTVPQFIINNYGNLINEIRGSHNMAYDFTIVPFDRLRWCGNGSLNQRNIFASYYDQYLYLKSKDESFRMLDNIRISGIFEDPLLVTDINGVPQITVDSGTYPINGELFDTIKNEVIKNNIIFMLKTPSDEVSDSSGAIIT